MKRIFVSENGSMGPLEGLVLAAFAVALIVGIRFVAFTGRPEPPKKAVSVSRPNDWPELPDEEPRYSANPLRK